MRAYTIINVILQKNIIAILHEKGVSKIVARNRKEAKMLLSILRHVPLDVFL